MIAFEARLRLAVAALAGHKADNVVPRDEIKATEQNFAMLGCGELFCDSAYIAPVTLRKTP